MIGPYKSLAVPYQDDFNAYRYPTTRGMPNFCGASLPAFVKLARKKGYRLAGCNPYGFNAFFIRNPLGLNQIPRDSDRGLLHGSQDYLGDERALSNRSESSVDRGVTNGASPGSPN
jgi:hypothetical protein